MIRDELILILIQSLLDGNLQNPYQFNGNKNLLGIKLCVNIGQLETYIYNTWNISLIRILMENLH